MIQRALCLSLLCLIPSSVNAALTYTTFNFDFGNGPAYVGQGLLGSGGTYWNKITISPSGQLNVPPLLNEFGSALSGYLFDPFNGPFLLAPNLNYDIQGSANTDTAQGPLADGITIDSTNGFFGLSIRELTPHTPVELIVYFNSPVGGSSANSIIVNTHFSSGDTYTATNPTGLFLGGQAGRDYISISNVPLVPTTIGLPMWPGVLINVPQGSVANIAAFQIRGTFRHAVPEPTSSVLLLVASTGFIFRLTRIS
jgi:hypothetical protein